MNGNKEELELWYNQIKDYPKFSYKDAKRLYYVVKLTGNKKEKEILRQELIKGMINELYYEISDSKLVYLTNPDFEMSDIINSACESMIEMVDSGKLEESIQYSRFFGSEFYTKIYDKLGIEKEKKNLMFEYTKEDLFFIMNYFNEVKKQELSPSLEYNSLLECLQEYFSYKYKPNNSENKEIYDFLNYTYDLLSNNLELGFNESRFIQKFLLSLYFKNRFEDINSLSTYDNIEDKIMMENVSKKIDNSTLKFSRKIYIKRLYGLGEEEENNAIKLAKLFNITNTRSYQLRDDTIKRIRQKGIFKDYEEFY